MGTDIHGWIECKHSWQEDGEPWGAVMSISWLVDRYYDAFGSFFGMRNKPLFGPIAADRGLPDDVSEQVKEALVSYGDEDHSHTWIAWTEIKAINWEEDKAASEEDRERLRAIFSWGQHLFQVLDILGKLYGEERVRLVVWFDS